MRIWSDRAISDGASNSSCAGCATDDGRFNEIAAGLAGLQSAETLLAPLREKLLGGETSAALGRIWVLPPNARWEDLTFEFTAEEEVVNVRFGPQTRRFEPEQFGLKNKKNGRPTSGWILLRSMARQGGSLTWKDRTASAKIKKQKQLLSNSLQKLFGIDSDPIRVAFFAT